MIATVLLLCFLVFILIDALQGLRRGLFPSLTRIASIVGVIILAFFTAEYIGDHIMFLEFTYEGDKHTFEELMVLYIQNNNFEEALNYSDTIKQLVMHLPEILVKEILFVPLFFIYRLITLPIVGIVNKIAFPKKKKRRDESDAERELTEQEQEKEKKDTTRRRWFRFGGMIVGTVQGIICFLVVMVPVFGICHFGTDFVEAFDASEHEAMVGICDTMDEDVIQPIENAAWVKTLDFCGLRKLCVYTFEELSHTPFEQNGEVIDIYYFVKLKATFPALNAFLLLQDIDPEHMTSEDYQKLNHVFATAKDSEEVASVLGEVTNSMVSDYVSDEYRGSADVFTDVFLDEVMAEQTDTQNVDFEKELGAIKTILEVMSLATDENAEHAFGDKDIDTVVDTIVDTDVTFTTVLKVSNDDESSQKFREEINMNESMKEKTEKLLNDYRSEQSQTAAIEEYSRIIEATDALAAILGITLSDDSSNLTDEIPA